MLVWLVFRYFALGLIVLIVWVYLLVRLGLVYGAVGLGGVV